MGYLFIKFLLFWSFEWCLVSLLHCATKATFQLQFHFSGKVAKEPYTGIKGGWVNEDVLM